METKLSHWPGAVWSSLYSCLSVLVSPGGVAAGVGDVVGAELDHQAWVCLPWPVCCHLAVLGGLHQGDGVTWSILETGKDGPNLPSTLSKGIINREIIISNNQPLF